jgi:hypothetical protein
VVGQLHVAAPANKAALCTYTNALRCQCVALLDALQVSLVVVPFSVVADRSHAVCAVRAQLSASQAAPNYLLDASVQSGIRSMPLDR